MWVCMWSFNVCDSLHLPLYLFFILHPTLMMMMMAFSGLSLNSLLSNSFLFVSVQFLIGFFTRFQPSLICPFSFSSNYLWLFPLLLLDSVKKFLKIGKMIYSHKKKNKHNQWMGRIESGNFLISISLLFFFDSTYIYG